MSVYQIRNLTRRFKVLEHDPYQRAIEQGDDVLLKRLHREPVESNGLQDIWKIEEADFTSYYATAQEIPDISVWRTFLVVSSKAKVALEPYIAHEGEFLPIIIDSQPFDVFNVMSFGKEDPTGTEAEYIDGYKTGILSLAFDESDVKSKYVFKSKEEGCTLLYCDDKLKKLCIDNNLKGVEFDLDLLDSFDY